MPASFFHRLCLQPYPDSLCPGKHHKPSTTEREKKRNMEGKPRVQTVRRYDDVRKPIGTAAHQLPVIMMLPSDWAIVFIKPRHADM